MWRANPFISHGLEALAPYGPSCHACWAWACCVDDGNGSQWPFSQEYDACELSTN